MKDDLEKLKALLGAADGDADNAGLIDSLKRDYLFFALPECMALKERWHSLTREERDEELSRLSLAFPDESALERVAEPDGDRFDDFYPAEDRSVRTPSTGNAIDKFLAIYGTSEPGEVEILEKLIFNPVADYSQQLARQEQESLPGEIPTGDSQEDRINRFILAVRGSGQPKAEDAGAVAEEPAVAVADPEKKSDNVGGRIKSPAESVSHQEPSENSLLSESLAKIYIKTHRYERAYEILNRLSLAFPEKSAYFADQLRFLRKLMLVESHRKKSQ